MATGTESQVGVGKPTEIEVLGSREPLRIVVGRLQHQQDLLAGTNAGPVNDDVFHSPTRDKTGWRDKAQQLFDRTFDQSRCLDVCSQQQESVTVLKQGREAVRKQFGRRHTSSRQQHRSCARTTLWRSFRMLYGGT